MTDARFPERWLNDRRIVGLTPTEFRGFIEALAWCAANRTDGHIRRRDVDLLRWCDKGVLSTLVDEGLVVETPDGYYLPEYEDTQTTRAELESMADARRAARDKKRRQRAKPALQVVPGDVPGDVPVTSPGTTQARPGQARQRRT